jgi:hypothetical protein
MIEDDPRLICVLAAALRALPLNAHQAPEMAAEALLKTLRLEGFRVSDVNPNKRGDFW